VGPNLSGRDDVGAAAADDKLLVSAYRSSLRLANERGFKSVAFPAISCGVFAFPLPAAARVAMQVTLKISRAPARARARSLSLRKRNGRAHVRTYKHAQTLNYACVLHTPHILTKEGDGRGSRSTRAGRVCALQLRDLCCLRRRRERAIS